ncbi:hypothetical protein [Roseibium album]|uniref:hypothetical protein n=1 Tax=Roseibium album TaxID=311410 RepID=UPI0024930FE8|nr:hypothetical protein [Roseibium album]
MWGKIVSLFLSRPFNRIFKSIDHAVSNDSKRQEIRANAVNRYAETAAEERADARRYRAFWFIWCLFSGSVGFWFLAITLDTVFDFSWSVADYPPSVKPYVDTIVASIFGSGGLVASAQALSSAIRGRR